MPSQMTTLDPAPEVVVADPWRLMATDAGRYARGLSTTLHLCEGERRDRMKITHLGVPDDVTNTARSFAFSAGVREETMRQALLDLVSGIEEALRRQNEDARRARETRGSPKTSPAPGAGGIAMRARFRVQADGVWYHEPPDATGLTPPPVWICAELQIVGATRDAHHDNHGHALEFRDRHRHQQRWVMPLAMLEDRRDYRRVLRRRGLLMNGSKQGSDLLQLYLDLCHAQTTMVCVEKTGWHQGMYVLPDATLGHHPGDEQVVLQGLEHTVEGYRQAGTLQGWQAKIARLCAGNNRLLLACSMGFAAALLTPCGVEGGGMHLRGASSEGKTTVALVGASVWGEPGRVERWRATANALEGIAAAHNDNLLLLDELKEIDPREAGAVAYMLANGSGKRRGRPDGGTRPRLTWRVLFLSTGEISLAQHVEHAGQRVHAGQEVRLIDLAADAGQGHGVFEDLHGYASGQAFADALRQHVHETHGTAGRAFVEALVQDLPAALAQIRQVCEAFMEHVPTAATGQVRRVASRFGLIGAAGELATAAGITGWEAGAAVEAAATCFQAWLQQRGTLTNADEARALAQVRLFFERHGEARFTPWTIADGTPCPRCKGTGQHAIGECFQCRGCGVLEPQNANGHVHDRAGFRKDTADGRTEYFVLPEVFRKEISQGYEPVWLAKLLVGAGLLMPDAQGKATRDERLPTLGKQRVYRFTTNITGAAG